MQPAEPWLWRKGCSEMGLNEEKPAGPRFNQWKRQRAHGSISGNAGGRTVQSVERPQNARTVQSVETPEGAWFKQWKRRRAHGSISRTSAKGAHGSISRNAGGRTVQTVETP